MPTFVPIARRILALARPNTDDLHLDLATGAGLVPAVDRRPSLADLHPAVAGRNGFPARCCAPPGRRPRRPGWCKATWITCRSETPASIWSRSRWRCTTCPRRVSPFRSPPAGAPPARAARAGSLGRRAQPVVAAFDAWFERAGLGAVRSDRPNDLRVNTEDRLRSRCSKSAASGPSRSPVSSRPSSSHRSRTLGVAGLVPGPTYQSLMAVAPDRRKLLRADCLATLQPLVTDEVRADQAVLFAHARP